MARKSSSDIIQVTDSLKEMVQNGDILRYTEEELEIKFKFTRKTLRKHLSKIKQEIGSRDIKIITLRLVNILDDIMGDIEKYWRIAREQQDEQKMAYYSKQMFFAIEKFTDFLERFGIKDKISDKVDVRAVVINADVNIADTAERMLKGL